MALPVQTPEQRAELLRAAQQTRAARALVRKNLKAGTLTLTDVLDDHGDVTAGMKVSVVLASLPRMGKVTAARLMEQAGIAGNRRVRGLGAAQRRALEKALAA